MTFPEIIPAVSPQHALTLKYKFSAGFEAWLWLQFDVHWDSPECQLPLLKRHLSLAQERNAAIIDGGDLHDLISSRSDKRGTKDTLRKEHAVGDYLDRVREDSVDWWSPYANNIAYIGAGNHDAKIRKVYETDFTKLWCSDLDRLRKQPIHRAGYGGWVVCRFEHKAGGRFQRVRLKIFHGVGGGGEVTKGTMEAQRLGASVGNADLVATGHVHEKWQVNVVQEWLNDLTGEVQLRERQHIKCGSYKLDYRVDGAPTWHMMRPGGTPKPLGGKFIRFYSPDGGRIAWDVVTPDVDYAKLRVA